jgi:hypothetical protein
MSSPLCGTGFAVSDVLCDVINNLDGLQTQADAFKTQAELALASLESVANEQIEGLAAVDYDGTALSGVDLDGPDAPTFSGGAAPTVPAAYDPGAASTLLISSTVLDDIFNREAARLSQVGVKDERDAQYRLSSMGIGMPSTALAMALAEAQQNTNNKTSQTAQDKAIAEGEWLRDDVKTLHELNIRNWPLKTELDVRVWEATHNKFRADIQLYAEQRGWTELEVRALLEQADKATGYALEKAKVLYQVATETQKAISQFYVGLTASLYSAANYNLSGSGSLSHSTSNNVNTSVQE